MKLIKPQNGWTKADVKKKGGDMKERKKDYSSDHFRLDKKDDGSISY
jgi:hypothetical protein